MCETEVVCMPAHIIPDDDSISETSTNDIDPSPREHDHDENLSTFTRKQFTDNQEENMTEFLSQDESRQINIVESDEDGLQANTPYAELLRWDYRLGHMSFAKLKAMAKLGILPRRLANVENPKRASCYFRKMTKKNHGGLYNN